MKITLTIILVFLSINLCAQTENDSKNELKLNALYSLGGIPELSYEYLLNNKSAVGIGLLYAFEDDNDIKFALTPYYRMYFGNKRAAGFFAEAFAMYNITEKNEVIYYNPLANTIPFCGTGLEYPTKNEADFALGVAVGVKLITKKDFVFELYGGLGRNLINDETIDAVPRLGVSFGKRF